MTTNLYAYITPRSTKDTALPAYAKSQKDFNRRTRDAFNAQNGGHWRVGEIHFYSTQSAEPGMLLCDGSVVNIIDFRELFEKIGTAHGGDGITTFGLPNYHSQAITTPALSVTQTISAAGTVTVGTAVTNPSGAAQTGGTKGGNILSGGRRKRAGEAIP